MANVYSAIGDGLYGGTDCVHTLQEFMSDATMLPGRQGDWVDGGKWQKADDIMMNQVLYTRGDEINAKGFVLYSYAYFDTEQTAEEMKNLRSVLR